MGNSVRVRSPLVEGLLVLGQSALTNTVRTLTVKEENLLRGVFKASLNYDEIQIATTNLGAKKRPYTFANTIRIPPPSTFDERTLVHEATHVWQYQTKGSGYISDSAWHQLTDPSAYVVTIIPNQALIAYTAERQAVIVEAYYADQQTNPSAPAKTLTYDPTIGDANGNSLPPPSGWSLLPDVVRMIGELQAARPISDQAKLEDRLFGPGGVPKEVPGAPKIDPVLPILRVEF